ncbi:MAG: sugar transferase [Ardenticatenaceae bacterium]|nr:sugar transferase [Ardenticatenaceae bacterium]
MDLFITLLILPVFLLIFIALAIAIKLGTPGPIIFRQLRTGKDGRRFHMYKFRTMVANAEEQKKELADLNDLGELDGPLKLGLNDPRITRVGRFLRKTSLDELPQMFNIIKGDMSWVGPRPTSWGLTSYELWHTERLDTLPGITGLWQLCGRGDTEFEHWVRWDIAYVRRQSLAFDLEILLRTFLHVVKQRGAH